VRHGVDGDLRALTGILGGVDVTREDAPMATATPGPLELRCPRCGMPCSTRFYGPCDDCRDLLRASMGSEAREVEAVEYEPKMNVTPNAVAQKD